MSKYRHEVKYLINTNEAEILKRRLLSIMEPDKNGKEGYFIRSLYFDTPDNKYYHEKMDGVLYRRKYRIRMYNKSDSVISLEKKCKDDNLTYKKQARITKETLKELLENKLSIDDCDNELLKEFVIAKKLYGLLPSVMVDYDRFALTYPISDVRITFDSNIRSGVYNYDLFKYDTSYGILDNNVIVLEVKYNEILPASIEAILRTSRIARSSFSKFARCRSIK